MTARRRGIAQLVCAAVAVAGCVASWLGSRSTVQAAPIAAGQPPTTSITFYPPLIVLALLLLTVAGVLVVLGVANLRRASPWVPGPAQLKRG